MEVESEPAYSESLQLPLSNPEENILLPPLSTMLITSLTAPSFKRHTPKSFLSTASEISRPISDNEFQARQSFIEVEDTKYPFNVPNSSTNTLKTPSSTAHHVKPFIGGFEFIQITNSSGKPDSAGGSAMRSHIRKRTNENRRRLRHREIRGNTFLRPALHRCSRAQSPETFEQTFENVANQLNFLPAPNQPFISSSFQSLDFGGTLNEESCKIISSEAVCTQCGKLLLQQTRDDRWTLLGESYKISHGMLDSDSHDPFDSLAIPISHKMHGLIHYYIQAMIIPSSPPIYHGDGFLDLMNVILVTAALSDAVCTRAIVASAAYHLATTKLNCLSPLDWKGREDIEQDIDDARYQMLEGVRLLNKKFDDPKQALTVAALFGAALLALSASYLDDEMLLESYYQGLLKMIELRGGINTVPRNLANQITRMSSNWAWKKRTKAKVPMYKSRFQENGAHVSVVDICSRSVAEIFPGNRPYVALQPASSPFLSTAFETFLWGDLYSAACHIHNLSYMLDLNMRHPKSLGSLQREFFEDTYAAAFHSLVCFPYPDDASIKKTTAYYRQHVWRVAAIIYLYTGIREWDKPLHAVSAVMSEFILYLRAADLYSMWSSAPEVLMWLLFVGTCGISDTLDRRWLLIEIKHGIRLLGIKSSRQLEDLLRTMLFVDSMKVKFLDTIWWEVMSHS